jgi:hypothetical protein
MIFFFSICSLLSHTQSSEVWISGQKRKNHFKLFFNEKLSTSSVECEVIYLSHWHILSPLPTTENGKWNLRGKRCKISWLLFRLLITLTNNEDILTFSFVYYRVLIADFLKILVELQQRIYTLSLICITLRLMTGP